MTVRQYQDIDGCLNAIFNARKWIVEDEAEDETLFGECEGVAEALYGRDGLLDPQGPSNFRMKWNSRLVDALNEMDVELVWTTTWRKDAFRVGQLMGLTNKNVRVLHPKSGWSEFPSIYWKYEALGWIPAFRRSVAMTAKNSPVISLSVRFTSPTSMVRGIAQLASG